MKDLKVVLFEDINPKANYLVLHEEYERYPDEPAKMQVGSGEEIIQLIKDVFDYDTFLAENVSQLMDEDLLKEFLAEAEQQSGEGEDFIEVYEIPGK